MNAGWDEETVLRCEGNVSGGASTIHNVIEHLLPADTHGKQLRDGHIMATNAQRSHMKTPRITSNDGIATRGRRLTCTSIEGYAVASEGRGVAGRVSLFASPPPFDMGVEGDFGVDVSCR
jgi:hypothetical protein